MSPAQTWFTSRRFAGILGALILATFPGVLFGGQSFFYRDYGVLAYPTIHYWREAIWHAELPLWNPLSNCGVPFLAQWGTMVLYPGDLIFLCLPLPWSLGVFCLLHLYLGGCGMYLLARRWVGDGFGASLAGVGFVFNGITLSCLLWPNYLVALGWMPLVVWLAELAWLEGGRRVVWAALAGALQWLAGVPEIVLLTWLIVASVAGLALVRGDTPRSRVTLRLALAVVLMLGLTAAQTLPFLDLLAHSQRGAGFATAKWSLPTWGWANLIVPLYHCFQTTQGVFFQHDQEFFSSLYLGPALVALVCWAAWRTVAAAWRRERPGTQPEGAGEAKPSPSAVSLGFDTGRFWLLLVLVPLSVAFAWGENGFLYRALRLAVPIAGVARYPVKGLLLVGFALPLLGAFAARRWMDGARDGGRGVRSLAVCAGLVIVCMGGVLWSAHQDPLPLDQWPATWHNAALRASFLLGSLALLVVARATSRPAAGLNLDYTARRPTLLGLGVLALLWLDFYTATPRQNPTIPARFLEPELTRAAAPALKESGRVFISPRAEEVLLRSRVADFVQDFVGKRLALWSNLNLLAGVAKINGSATLQLREQAEVQSMLYATPTIELPRLADFLGAAYSSSPSNVVDWIARPTALPLMTAGQQPRFVPEATARQALTNADFDGARVVYLPTAAVSGGVTNATTAVISNSAFAPGRITFELQAEAPAWVVVAQSYYHPWKVEVNGRAAPLWRANYAFQAFAAPAGHSHGQLIYRDGAFWLGMALSGLTLTFMGVWWWAAPRSDQRPRRSIGVGG